MDNVNGPVSQGDKDLCRKPSAQLILALSFRDSLDPEIYADTAEQLATNYANEIGLSGSATTLSLAATRSICERNTITVGLSRKLSKRLREGSVRYATKGGKRTGEVIYAVGNPQSKQVGNFAGKATEVGSGLKVARTAASAALAVVEISHLIAGADMARMQRETIEKLSKLEAYHDIAQESELERLYFRARDVLGQSSGSEIRRTVMEIRSQLLGLRIRWRKEIEHNLNQLKDTRNRGWVSSVLSGQERRDYSIIGSINAELKKMVLIDYTLRLDHTIGMASETWNDTRSTIEDELNELRRLGLLLKDKCYYVSDKRRENVASIQRSFSEIVPYYEELLDQSNLPNSGSPVLSLE